MLDPDAIKSKFANNGPIITRVVQAFRDSWPGLLEQIKTAHAGGSGDDLGKAAHSLKGSLGYIAGEAIVAKAATLEKMGKSGELDPAAPLINEFETDLRTLDGMLVDFLGTLS